MTLLAPLFLLGLLAVGLPIWLHRMARSDPQRRLFGSTLLLERTEQQTTTQSELRFRWLMALRILFVILLVLLFTEPFLNRTPPAALGLTPQHHFVVLDTSLSMQRPEVWGQAQSAAKQVINSLANSDTAQLISAAKGLTLWGNATSNSAELTTQLAAITPGFQRLDFGDMMKELNRLTSQHNKPVVLHFITDGQTSGLPLRFADLAANRFAQFQLIQIPYTEESRNLSVTGYADAKNQLFATLHLSDTSAARLQALTVTLETYWNGALFDSRTLSLTESDTRVELPTPALAEGENRIEFVLVTPDALAQDNRYALVVHRPTPVRVALFHSGNDLNAQRDQLYFTSALNAIQESTYAVQPFHPATADTYLLSDFDFVVSLDAGALNDANRQRIDDYVRRGGRALLVLGSGSTSLSSVPISGLAISNELTSSDSEGARINQISPNHAVTQLLPTWQQPHLERWMRVTTDETTHNLMTLTDGSPLLIEQTKEQGRLLLLTSSLDNRWNNLPITNGFVALVKGMADYLTNHTTQNFRLLAGDTLKLQGEELAIGQVFSPSDEPLLSFSEAGQKTAIQLNEPGFYTVQNDRGRRLVTVNTDSRESDSQSLNAGTLARWQALPVGTSSSVIADAPSSTDTRLELWHFLLPLAALCLLAESLFANHHLRIRREST